MLDLIKSSQEEHDKSVLTLSSAGLTLSMVFLKWVVPLDKAEHLWILQASWLLFTFSIILVLCSFLTSKKSLEVQRKNGKEYYLDGADYSILEKGAFKKFTVFLNWTAPLSFVAGLLAILFFMYLNT